MTLVGLAPARADDWRVVSVQGEALVAKSGSWISLRIDDVVSDDSPVRTLSNSSVAFQRDHEKISVMADTQIRIVDRVGQRYTTVNDIFGVVAIEANVQNVQHFAVKTKYLAAVVKGTIFSVSADSASSSVVVTRGLVQVTDAENGKTLDVPAGKSTTVGKNLSPTLKEPAKGAAATDAAMAMAAASAAAPPTPPTPPAGDAEAKPGADAKPDAAKGDAKADGKGDGKDDGKDPKAADKASAEAAAAVKAAKADGAGKEPSPDEIAAGAKAAGIEKGKFKAKDAAEGAKVVSAVAQAAAPDADAPPPPAPPKIVAAPLISLILQLDSGEQTMVWLGLGAVFFGVGALLNVILKDVGFGAMLNGLIAMVGGVVGAEVRDQFFFDEDWFSREPYVSIGLITLFSFAAVMAACVLKYRELSKPVPSASSLAAARRPKPRERFIK